MKAVVKKVTLPENKRILCISDVHGNLPWLKGLLEKANYTEDDVLIFIGDLVEKGKHSLATLRYIMELAEKGVVYAVRGNCDGWNDDIDNDTDADLDNKVRRFISSSLPGNAETLLRQMCREAGIKVSPDMDMAETKRILREKFKAELDFMRAMPQILDTQYYTFVHAGLPGNGPLEEMDADKCEKCEDYMHLGYRFDKWVIVGHYPVMNYRSDICSLSPVVDWRNHIISIDGGCVVKEYGQLNALVIPKNGSEEFDDIYYDDFPVYKVRTAQEKSKQSLFVHYGDNMITILQPGMDVSLCQHIRTGRRLEIPTDYLSGEGRYMTCKDITDYELPLNAGDEVSLIDTTPMGHLVKKGSVMGWYVGELQ